MSENSIKDWLKETHAEGMLCGCGDFACHNPINCHNCGTEFKKVQSTTREGLIRRKARYRGRERAIRWFVALDWQYLKEKYGVKTSPEVIASTVHRMLFNS